MLKKKIPALAIATAAVASSIVTIPAASAQTSPAGNCSAVDIVVAAGTGEGNSKDDPSNIYGLRSGVNYAANIDKKFGDKVSAWQVPYTASVGMVGTMGETKSDQGLPYGASRLQGTKAAEAHIADLKKSCPDTKFILTGFSQGATVAGDVTANLVAGKIPGVTEDDLLGAYLLADPGRAKVTEYKGVSPLTNVEGLLTENGAVLIRLDQSVPATNRVGLTGPRPANAFKGTEGKVLTFCHNDDVACSTDENGILMNLGKAMNEWTENYPDHITASPEGLKGLNLLQVLGGLKGALSVLTKAAAGDASGVRAKVLERAKDPSLTPKQQAAVRGLAEELAVVAESVGKYQGTVPKYKGENLAGGLSGALPSIVPLVLKDDPKKIANLIPYVLNMMPHHLSYFVNSEHGPWTIGGVTVDQWIQTDMDTRITKYLAQAPTTPSTTVAPKPTTSSSTTVAPKPTTSSSTTVAPKPTTSSSTTVAPKPTTSSSTTVAPKPTTSSSTTVAPKPTTSSSTTVAPKPTTSSSTTVAPKPTTSSSTTVAPRPTEPPKETTLADSHDPKGIEGMVITEGVTLLPQNAIVDWGSVPENVTYAWESAFVTTEGVHTNTVVVRYADESEDKVTVTYTVREKAEVGEGPDDITDNPPLNPGDEPQDSGTDDPQDPVITGTASSTADSPEPAPPISVEPVVPEISTEPADLPQPSAVVTHTEPVTTPQSETDTVETSDAENVSRVSDQNTPAERSPSTSKGSQEGTSKDSQDRGFLANTGVGSTLPGFLGLGVLFMIAGAFISRRKA